MKAVWSTSDNHLNALTGELPVIVCLSLGWRDVPDKFKQTVAVNHDIPSSVANYTVSFVFYSARRWIKSPLYRPLMVTASALSWLSPLSPTEGSIPASASRSVDQMLTYCEPLSE